MKRNQNNQSFMQKVKEWIKANKVKSIIIAILVIIVAFAIDDPSQEQQEKDNKPATEQSEKQHAKEDKADKKADEKEVDNKEVADAGNDVEEVKTDVEEVKTDVEENKQDDELSDEFRTYASNYLDQVAISYMTLGDLQTATSESEMMSVIKDGQSEYDKSNQYFTQLDPQNDKEQKIFEKLSKIDGLTSRALMNVEAGLNDYDADLINSATEDIEQAGQIATEIETEVE